MCDPAQMSDTALNDAVQEGRDREYSDNVRASVVSGTLASSAADQHCSSNTSGGPKQLGAQFRQSSGNPFKFEAPAGDSDPLHRLHGRRRANRDSARRVRERRTQQCDALEAQAAESSIMNKRLLKKMADVQGDHSTARSLLRAFHLKVAHMQGMNESLQVQIAIMDRRANAQVRHQLQIVDVCPAHALGWKDPDATANRAPPAAELLLNAQAWAPISNSPPLLQRAVQREPSQAKVVSPFATAAPTALLSQAAPLPMLSKQEWEANLSLDQSSQTTALYTRAVRADSMDAILSALALEQPAGRMQRLSSLTLSCGMSAMLNVFPQP